MAKRETEEPFFPRLAAYMTQEDKDIFVAATELELGLTSSDCQKIAKNKAFQRLLRGERIKRYNELANDPNRSKSTLVGQAVHAIEKLLDAEQYDKALAGLINLARIEGYVGNESNVNVFTGLSSKDLEKLRANIKQQQDGLPSSSGNA